MDLQRQQQHVEGIAQRFAQVAPAGWARLVGNWEATGPVAAPVLNFLTLAVVDGEDRWLYGQVAYDEALYDRVAAYHSWSATSGDGAWTVLDLEVDADGDYRTEHSYGVAKRSSGVVDHESTGRFEDYLQTWIDEHGPVPGGAR